MIISSAFKFFLAHLKAWSCTMLVKLCMLNLCNCSARTSKIFCIVQSCVTFLITLIGGLLSRYTNTLSHWNSSIIFDFTIKGKSKRPFSALQLLHFLQLQSLLYLSQTVTSQMLSAEPVVDII